jgi:phosphatidylglycerophosphatase A
MSKLIATVFGIGHFPAAPGTFASLMALPVALLLHYLGGFTWLLIATVVAFGLGLWAATAETRDQEDQDPGEIVIDEFVGQWIALFPLSFGVSLAANAPDILTWPGWILAFLCFRFFDVFKPGIIRKVDNWNTPMGLMLDDVLAGFAAGIVVLIVGFAVSLVL